MRIFRIAGGPIRALDGVMKEIDALRCLSLLVTLLLIALIKGASMLF